MPLATATPMFRIQPTATHRKASLNCCQPRAEASPTTFRLIFFSRRHCGVRDERIAMFALPAACAFLLAGRSLAAAEISPIQTESELISPGLRRRERLLVAARRSGTTDGSSEASLSEDGNAPFSGGGARSEDASAPSDVTFRRGDLKKDVVRLGITGEFASEERDCRNPFCNDDKTTSALCRSEQGDERQSGGASEQEGPSRERGQVRAPLPRGAGRRGHHSLGRRLRLREQRGGGRR